MSRFSRAEAIRRGWTIVHNVEGELVRAEKYFEQANGPRKRIVEEAETVGKLLERIHAYEQHRGQKA